MGYPPIRSNPHGYRARAAFDGQQPILATSPVRPHMPKKSACSQPTRSSCTTSAKQTSATRASSRAVAISPIAPHARPPRTASATSGRSSPSAKAARARRSRRACCTPPVSRRAPGPRRRHPRVAGTRRRDDDLPPLRRLARSSEERFGLRDDARGTRERVERVRLLQLDVSLRTPPGCDQLLCAE